MRSGKPGAGHRYTNRFGQRYTGANRHATTNTDGDSDSYSYSNANQHTLAHGNEYAHSDTNTKAANRRGTFGGDSDPGRYA